jgi:Fur family ferric uptake transcriptional regulator
MGKATADDALQAFEEFLRGKRLKMTAQRRHMVRAALEQPGHFTAEDLHGQLGRGSEGVSMATVYRALRLLEESGIVEGHDFADGQRRYEPKIERDHHDHMVCLDCRAVVEFQNERIERLQDDVARAHGFEIREHNLTLFVSCDAWRTTGACERREALGRRRRG